MPLVQAKCTNCGANLEIDNTKDAAICPYCGTAFVVEKAINNYNTTNQIQAGVVNVYGGNGADFVIRGGVLEKYNGAAMEIVVPNSVKIIGEDAFTGCIGITTVVLPDSVQEIRSGSHERGAFAGCTAMTSIVIPNSVQKIGSLAFKDCKSLASVTIPDSVQTIGWGAFSGCSSLTSVKIPDSVQKIGSGAFEDCSSLSSIIIPNSIQEIALFSGCSSLTSVKIPNSVREIGSSAFSRCKSLTLITIPDSVRTIGDSAFYGCSSLTTISIPSSVKRIDQFAFARCTALRKVKIDGDPEISSIAFGGTAFERRDVQIVEASEEWKKEHWNVFECLKEYQPDKGGCYVATAVYGSYDCPEVWTLRRFRDDTLDRTWYGRAFIRTYYAISPTLVRWFGACGWFQRLFRAPLDRLVARLHRRGVQDTPYRDKY